MTKNEEDSSSYFTHENAHQMAMMGLPEFGYMTCCHRVCLFVFSSSARFHFGVHFYEKLNGFNELINVENDGRRWKSAFLWFIFFRYISCKMHLTNETKNEDIERSILSMLKHRVMQDRRHFEIFPSAITNHLELFRLPYDCHTH